MKAESKGQAAEVLSGADVKTDDIKKIVFACDAGMGSSGNGKQQSLEIVLNL